MTEPPEIAESVPSKKEVRKKKRKELRKIRDTVKQLGSPEEIRKFRIFLDEDLRIENIEALIKFHNLLTKEKITVEELENALNRLRDRNITISSFASIIENADKLKAEYGRPYSELVEGYKHEEEKIQKMASLLKDMEAMQNDLEAKISDTKKLLDLQESLKQNGLSLDSILSYVNLRKQLSEFGFDQEVLRRLGEEVQRLGIDPKEAGVIIGRWLLQTKQINESIKDVTTALEESKRRLDRTRKEEDISAARLKSFDQKIIESQKKMESLELEYSKRKESLENEHKTRQQALVAKLEQEEAVARTASLENRSDLQKLIDENRTLKDQAEAIKREIDLVMSISIILEEPQALSAAQLDNLVSEFTSADYIAEKAESSPSLERLIEARRVLLSALRKWSLMISS
jgi:hypothetical protein